MNLPTDQARASAMPAPAAAASTPAASPRPGLPRWFGVELDPDMLVLDDGALCGGVPLRVVRLSEAGRQAWTGLLAAGVVTDEAQAALARRLVDAGLAHPRPLVAAAADVTVLVPVRDRADELDECLAAIGRAHDVVVVDDASQDPYAVAAVAARHGARLVRRRVNGGPGPARNTGLEHVTSELVAFVDSDCAPPAGWLDSLAGHFADPLVGAVAPRIRPARVWTPAERYATRHGCLDLGPRAAPVRPATRVSFVPSAALVVRRSALADVGGFDPALRYGEDVDLVWRLAARGWLVRYEPAVLVRHREPASWRALLTRRFRYGTAAGGLARRHGSAMAPLRVQPLPALAVTALLARRPGVAAAATAAAIGTAARATHRAGLRPRHTGRFTTAAARHTWLGVARYARQFGAPLLLAALTRRGWPRRAALALLFSPPDPRRLADDVAYGLGVYAGAWRSRTAIPLRPVLVRSAAKGRSR